MPQEILRCDLVVLQAACEKIVAYGEKVGVGPGVMIELLDQGATVRELLDFLSAQKIPVN